MYNVKSPLNKMKIFMTLFIMVILVYSYFPFFTGNFVSAATTIDPPWQPVMITSGEIANHQSKEYQYTLQAGKVYHIFLVGNWTEPSPTSTDYDVYINGPNNESYRFTESSGLPEQIFNDNTGQFFTPKFNGIYTFEIHNDSENVPSESAVFMLIEHIQTDVLYNATLLGRLSKNEEYPPSSQQTYACEFTTSSPFSIHVNTPENLDFYEVRLYPMATLDASGHTINGLPTPLGSDFYTNTTIARNDMYNYLIDGQKAPFYSSCYTYGVDVDIPFKDGLITPGSETTYFLVFVAEYSKTSTPSTVPFYVKIDNTPPEPTLFQPLDPVFSGETVTISADVSSSRKISSVWIDYSINGLGSNEKIPMTLSDRHYLGNFPIFSSKDHVEYKISAMDEIGNIGIYTSSFNVKNRTTTSCNLSTTYVMGGSTLNITGVTSKGGSNIALNFTCGSISDIIKVKSGASGEYSYSYIPKRIGQWTVVASYVGDDGNYASSSTLNSFIMKPQYTSVSCSLITPNVKVNEAVELVGTTVPPQAGLPLEVMITSGSEVKTLSLTTNDNGSFRLSEQLGEGTWNIVVQIKGNWRFSSSSSGIISASVIPLSTTEIILMEIALLATPPYIYLLVVASGILLALIVRWKSSWIAPRIPEPMRGLLTKFNAQKVIIKNQASGVRERYKRKNEES